MSIDINLRRKRKKETMEEPKSKNLEGVVALLFPVEGLPELVVLEPDAKGSYLRAMQDYVEGDVDFVDVLTLDGGPTLWVNDEGLVNRMTANRVVYSSEQMKIAGYLSQIHGFPVDSAEPYTVLHGPILAVGNDERGEMRSITPSEMKVVLARLGGSGSGQALECAMLMLETLCEDSFEACETLEIEFRVARWER